MSAAPRRGLRGVGVVLLLAVMGGCSKAPMTLPAQFDDRGIQRRVAARGEGCPLVLASVTDTRADPDSLGNVGLRELRASDFANWAKGGMTSRLAAGNGTTGTPLTLEAEVLKAYIQNIAISKSVDVVMRVRVSRDGQRLDERIYRGGTTLVNWVSAEDEMKGAFSMALASLVDQLRADAVEWCAPAAPAPAI